MVSAFYGEGCAYRADFVSDEPFVCGYFEGERAEAEF